MTPLALTLRGFASFRQETTIPFEELGSYQLFAISGPTGSGKSSILDGMTYALYGRTPRLGANADESLLSQGADSLFVEFTFAQHGTRYRASRLVEWRIGRDGESKKGGAEVRIEQAHPNEDGTLLWRALPETDKIRAAYTAIVEIIGLDYEGFTRSVLLPQGAFAEFLRGEASQRRSLLMKLLGAERIAEMQSLAGQWASDADKEHRFVQQRLEQLAEATPAQQRSYQQELESLEHQLERDQQQREHLGQQLDTMRTVRVLVQEQQQHRQTLATLTQQADAMEQRTKRLQRAQAAALIIPQQQRAQDSRTQLNQLQQTLSQLQSQAQHHAQQLEALQAEDIGARKEAIAQRAQHIQQLHQLQPKLETLSQAEGLECLAHDVAPQLPETALSFSQSILETSRHIRFQLPSLRQQKQAYEKLQQEIRSLQDGLSAQHTRTEAAKQALEVAKTAAFSAHQALEDAQAAERDAQTHADRQQHLAALCHDVQPGDPCPVCGSPLARVPSLEPGALQQAQQARQAAQAKLETAKADFEVAKTHYNDLASQHSRDQAYLHTLEARANNAKQDWQEASDALQTRLEPLPDFSADALSDLDALDDFLQTTQRQQVQALANSIRHGAATVGLELATLQDTHALKRLETEQQQAQQHLEQHQQALHAAEQAAALAQRDLSHGQAQHATAQTQADDYAKQWHDALQHAGFAEEADWQAAQLSPEAQAREHEILEDYQQQQQQVQQRLAAIDDTLNTSAFAGNAEEHEHAYQQALSDYEGLETSLQHAREAKGRLTVQLEQLARDLSEKREKTSQAQQLQQRYATFSQLNKDLRQNQFQEYIIARLQQDLAKRAGSWMRNITEGRYQLRFYPSEGEYSVIDYWNGGETRNVRTLSGGESFIASLCLALALSDAKTSHPLGALFLDEGFGTLDSQTLDSVAQTLENLSQTGRMVGIITHVRELTERLPACLLLSKSEVGSSIRLHAS